jgi:uncharacterized membrane protein
MQAEGGQRASLGTRRRVCSAAVSVAVESQDLVDAPDPLAAIPLFQRLDVEERRALYETMHEAPFDPNQAIFWLGDRGDEFYLVIRGLVAITVPNEKGELVTLNTLGPGGFFGEISLLDGGPRTATVRALEKTECLGLTRDAFHQFLRSRPDVAIEILTVMGQRQRASTELLRAMKNPNVVFEQLHMTPWQRAADFIAALAASQWFTLVHIAWFGAWIGVNAIGALLGLEILAFDPFPFGLLTMVVSLEAIFLSIFVMVSQNRQAEKDRVRTDLDYQVNVKAQTEIMNIARRLDLLETRLAPAPADEQARENLLDRT